MSTRSAVTTRNNSSVYLPNSRASSQSNISFAPTEKDSVPRRSTSAVNDVAQAALKLQYLLKLPYRPSVPPKPIDACAWTFEAVTQLQAAGHMSAAYNFAVLAKRQTEKLSHSQKKYLKLELMPRLLVSTLISNDRRTYTLLAMSEADFITPGGVKEALANKELQQNSSLLLRPFFTSWSAATTLQMAEARPLFRFAPWQKKQAKDKHLAASKKLTKKLVPTVLQSNDPAFVVALAGSETTAHHWAQAYGSQQMMDALANYANQEK